MKTNWLQTWPEKWLIIGLLVLTAFTLAFQTGQNETDPAHCRSCKPPTPTYTPTPTLIPPLQACQVVAVEFDKAEYLTGDPINITLRVEDAAGAPLIGANVDATVSRQPFTDTLEASAIPPLEDQSGTYDGIYTQTDLPGLYTFKFDVSDFTGPRFLPCSAERIVRVKPKKSCNLSVTATGGQQINDPITLTANVTVDGQPQSGATVTTSVRRPDDVVEGPFTFGGNGPYTLTYTKTDKAGPYTFFNLQASDQNGQFSACTAPDITVTVPDRPLCEFTPLEFDQLQYTLGQTIRFTSTLTNSSGITMNITATARRPDETPEPVPLVNTGMLYTGSYTRTTISGTYEIKMIAANAANAEICSVQGTRLVTGTIPLTPTIIIDLPPQPIELCGRPDPDITGTIAISNVTGLTGVQLEVSYAPAFIQVIDAFRRPRPPVQVKPDPNFDPFLNNLVDVGQGEIFFNANARSPITSRTNIIYVDWRLQGRTGVTPITVAAVITDAAGTQTVTETESLQIIIDTTCVQGTVSLQGRADHSGVIVSAPSGQQTQSYPSGLFAIPQVGPLSFVFPGYLAAQLAAPEGQAANLNTITLLAGDVNGDSLINILDMTYLAGRYQSADPTADLNASGIVDILDLTLAAGNYQRQGQ